jgi:hypothetical protein
MRLLFWSRTDGLVSQPYGRENGTATGEQCIQACQHLLAVFYLHSASSMATFT